MSGRRHRAGGGGRRVAAVAVLVAAVGFVAFCVAWRVDGGRWVHVESPSMGETAPVGSLLWVEQVPFDSLEPGDFITFTAPGSSGDVTYSHHVLDRDPDGSLITKGVIPGPDPWRLREDDVVGRVTMTWQGVGWLVVAAPVLLGGLCVAMALRAVLRPQWRLPATLVLGSLTVALALAIYSPLIGAERIAFVPTEAGARATYVGTGLLPVRVSSGDETTVLRAGEQGSISIDEVDEDGRYRAELGPAVPDWWWVMLVLVCFAPALTSTVARRAGRRTGDGQEPAYA